MKQIHVEDQPALSLGRIARLTIDGIRYRLFRASVTVAVIAVAIAFLVNVLGESLFKREVAFITRDQIENMRVAHVWASRITTPPAVEAVLREIADGESNDSVYLECMKMGSLSAGEMTLLRGKAQSAVEYLDFFEKLDYDRRRRLIHTFTGVEILDYLATPKGMSSLRGALDQMRSVRFVTTVEVLEKFLADWPKVKAEAGRVRMGRATAVRKIETVLAGRSVFEGLADASGAFGKAIADAGFSFDPETMGKEIVARVEQINQKRRIETTLESPAMGRLVAARKNVLPSDITTAVLWDMLRSKRAAAWYLAKMKENELDTESLDVNGISAMANLRRKEAALLRAERLTSDAGKGFLGLGERMGWLLIVSMLLCAVGISNAMLMTVTERFREIATLKCLGALDGFIMITFVFEACLMGVAGGVIGAILGGIISIGRMTVSFGITFLPETPLADLTTAMLISVGVGAALAAVSAMYPAYKAARLAPMEAMRIE